MIAIKRTLMYKRTRLAIPVQFSFYNHYYHQHHHHLPSSIPTAIHFHHRNHAPPPSPSAPPSPKPEKGNPGRRLPRPRHLLHRSSLICRNHPLHMMAVEQRSWWYSEKSRNSIERQLLTTPSAYILSPLPRMQKSHISLSTLRYPTSTHTSFQLIPFEVRRGANSDGNEIRRIV